MTPTDPLTAEVARLRAALASAPRLTLVCMIAAASLVVVGVALLIALPGSDIAALSVVVAGLPALIAALLLRNIVANALRTFPRIADAFAPALWTVIIGIVLTIVLAITADLALSASGLTSGPAPVLLACAVAAVALALPAAAVLAPIANMRTLVRLHGEQRVLAAAATTQR